MATTKQLRICSKGHRYYKSTDCPSCPLCEAGKKPKEGLLALLGAPARRALEAQGIRSAEDLSRWSETELLALHGFGPSSVPKLKEALKAKGLSFRKD